MLYVIYKFITTVGVTRATKFKRVVVHTKRRLGGLVVYQCGLLPKIAVEGLLGRSGNNIAMLLRSAPTVVTGWVLGYLSAPVNHNELPLNPITLP